MVYDQIWEKPGEVEIFGPPTIHLVANVENLIDLLTNTVMGEVVGETSDTTPPLAINHTDMWVVTSTYHVYMVDTLRTVTEEETRSVGTKAAVMAHWQW